MFQKILVPTDGSRYALRAAEYAADLARRYHTEVTVLLVADYQSVRASPAPDKVKADLEQALREANAAALSQTAAPFAETGVKRVLRIVSCPVLTVKV